MEGVTLKKRSANGPVQGDERKAVASGGIGLVLIADDVNLSGAFMGKKRRMVKVRAIDPQSPAAKSGELRVGDVIMAIDDRDSTTHEALVKALIRGECGSQVRLLLQTPGSTEQREVTLTRSGNAFQNSTGERAPPAHPGKENAISNPMMASVVIDTDALEQLKSTENIEPAYLGEKERPERSLADNGLERVAHGRAETKALLPQEEQQQRTDDACASVNAMSAVSTPHTPTRGQDDSFSALYHELRHEVLDVNERAARLLQQCTLLCRQAEDAVSAAAAAVTRSKLPKCVSVHGITGEEVSMNRGHENLREKGVGASEAHKWRALDQLSEDVADAQKLLAQQRAANQATEKKLNEALAALRSAHQAVCGDSATLRLRLFGGVGMAVANEVTKHKGKVTASIVRVQALTANGPAAASGCIKVGDSLHMIDEEDVEALDAEAVSLLLRGPAGSEVRIQGLTREAWSQRTRLYEVTLRRTCAPAARLAGEGRESTKEQKLTQEGAVRESGCGGGVEATEWEERNRPGGNGERGHSVIAQQGRELCEAAGALHEVATWYARRALHLQRALQGKDAEDASTSATRALPSVVATAATDATAAATAVATRAQPAVATATRGASDVEAMDGADYCGMRESCLVAAVAFVYARDAVGRVLVEDGLARMLQPQQQLLLRDARRASSCSSSKTYPSEPSSEQREACVTPTLLVPFLAKHLANATNTQTSGGGANFAQAVDVCGPQACFPPWPASPLPATPLSSYLSASHMRYISEAVANVQRAVNSSLAVNTLLSAPAPQVSEARPSHWLAQDDTARCTLEKKRCGGSAVAVVAAAGIARAGIGGGGGIGGIGVALATQNQALHFNGQLVKMFKITECLVKGAATGGNMRAGDVLLAINGQDLVANKYSMEAVKGLIRGPPGSQVRVKVLRREKKIGNKVVPETFEVTLIRN